MTELHWLEITGLAELIARREVSAVEVTQAQLDRIDALDGDLHAFATVTAEHALAAARIAESEIAAGRYRGTLHGIPLGIKDLFWTKGVPSAAGMAIHREVRPDRDATAVGRLRDAGAVMLGKLQMTEGAYSEHHPSVTPPVNPWDANYWTGISSSGPAAALAAGLCFGAIASDTGGSIRWPCGANGLTGIKPSWGRVSRDGMWALAPTMDHAGTMARSAADAALLLEAIAGPDPRDPTALQQVFARSDRGVAGLRIGYDPRWNEDDVEQSVWAVVATALDVFRDLGAILVEVQAPDRDIAPAIWPDLCAVEAAVAHAETYPALRGEYGPVLAKVIERGRARSAMDHGSLQLQRLRLRGEFDQLFTGIDTLLCPVQPFGPLSLKRLGTMGDQPEMIAKLQRFTAPFDLTGAPAMTLPGGQDGDGMPIGVQVCANALRDDVVIATGMAFQQATDWHRRHP